MNMKERKNAKLQRLSLDYFQHVPLVVKDSIMVRYMHVSENLKYFGQ